MTADRAGAPVVVVGAGAAGLMAALFAARSGAPTLLLERTGDGGRKILISGGGRCNVLPGTFRPGEYVTDSSPNSLRRILRSWPLEEQRRFFQDDLGIPLKHEEDGDKLFPVSDRARDVRDGLVEAVRSAGAEIRFQVTVEGIEAMNAVAPALPGAPGEAAPEEDTPGAGGGARWRVLVDRGPAVEARAVVLATGGLSVAATGSDGRGLRWARELGHAVNPTYPALTPLLADPPVHAHLAGVSLVSRLEARDGTGREARGGFLFTHRGYSGPAVLDVSHVAVRSLMDGEAPATVRVDWTGEGEAPWEARLREGARAVSTVLAEHLPARLAEQLQDEAGVPRDRTLAQLRREERQALVERLARYPLPWTGDEGYRKAEVTGGGVALDQVDPGTLESRLHPGLHLCGEMLDAFGPIGGHNFLWAWATGRAAGLGAAGARR